MRGANPASTLVTIRCNGRDAGRRPTLSGNRVPVGLATGGAILKCGLRRVLMPARAPADQSRVMVWGYCQLWYFLTPAMTPTGLDEAGFRWTGARQSDYQ
jgi:hypothetical protein